MSVIKVLSCEAFSAFEEDNKKTIDEVNTNLGKRIDDLSNDTKDKLADVLAEAKLGVRTLAIDHTKKTISWEEQGVKTEIDVSKYYEKGTNGFTYNGQDRKFEWSEEDVAKSFDLGKVLDALADDVKVEIALDSTKDLILVKQGCGDAEEVSAPELFNHNALKADEADATKNISEITSVDTDIPTTIIGNRSVILGGGDAVLTFQDADGNLYDIVAYKRK